MTIDGTMTDGTTTDGGMTTALVTETVVFVDGSRGRILSSALPVSDGVAEVLLDSGQRIFIVMEALIPLEEGGHRVEAHPSTFEVQAAEEDVTVIPLVAETMTVSKREIETGKVRFQTTVTERIETIDEPLSRTEVQTRRVEVNQFVDSPPPVRYEGDTMIVSILEEVLVVEKRLRVKEEVHITQVQTEYRAPQSVTLRTETLLEERVSV